MDLHFIEVLNMRKLLKHPVGCMKVNKNYVWDTMEIENVIGVLLREFTQENMFYR